MCAMLCAVNDLLSFSHTHTHTHTHTRTHPQVAYFEFSDDPWAPAQPTATLGPTLPMIYTQCDGCAHCGAGVPRTIEAQLTRKKIDLLQQWLGLRQSNGAGWG